MRKRYYVFLLALNIFAANYAVGSIDGEDIVYQGDYSNMEIKINGCNQNRKKAGNTCCVQVRIGSVEIPSMPETIKNAVIYTMEDRPERSTSPFAISDSKGSSFEYCLSPLQKPFRLALSIKRGEHTEKITITNGEIRYTKMAGVKIAVTISRPSLQVKLEKGIIQQYPNPSPFVKMSSGQQSLVVTLTFDDTFIDD